MADRGTTRTWSGARLKAFRCEKELSQEACARLIDTSLASLVRWEKQKVTPGADMAAQIADALEVDLNEFYENGRAA